MMKKKLLIVTNVDWFLISHRLVIAKAASKAGWKVYVACEDTGRADEIVTEGIELIPFKFSRSGTNLLEEYKTYRAFRSLYKKIRPDIVHQITIKPVVYGGLAAKSIGIRGVVSAISGMGYMFVNNKLGFAQRAILRLMKMGFNRANVAVIFQNEDDRNVLADAEVLTAKTEVYLIKGSGVDLNHFSYTPLPDRGLIKILLPCRMLWDKGVKELREASDLLKDRYKDRIQFVLVGMADDANKASVPKSYLEEWQDGHYVIWEGHQTDVLKYYRDSHIVVLPSYREGLPKTLIEACAVGRAIVTTDAIGCKDCIDEGINGFKVPVGDAKALAEALTKIIDNPILLEQMGAEGRKKAEREFNVDDVISKHLYIYESLIER